MARKPLPPLEVLDELLLIEDGKLINRVARGNVRAGAEAGSLDWSGYRYVSVQGSNYLAHRLIWAMTHRKDPGELEVDHIDRNRWNNHPSNLRAVTREENQKNRVFVVRDSWQTGPWMPLPSVESAKAPNHS